jgi:hypothetical protein
MSAAGKNPKLRAMRNYKPLHGHHYAALGAINNLYIEACAVVDALKPQVALSNREFEVPSIGGTTSTVQRSPSALHALIQNAVARREYEKLLILLVSVAEDHLFSYARAACVHPKALQKRYSARSPIGLLELRDRPRRRSSSQRVEMHREELDRCEGAQVENHSSHSILPIQSQYGCSQPAFGRVEAQRYLRRAEAGTCRFDQSAIQTVILPPPPI